MTRSRLWWYYLTLDVLAALVAGLLLGLAVAYPVQRTDNIVAAIVIVCMVWLFQRWDRPI